MESVGIADTFVEKMWKASSFQLHKQRDFHMIENVRIRTTTLVNFIKKVACSNSFYNSEKMIDKGELPLAEKYFEIFA